MHSFLQDFRYAGRMLRQNAAFSAIAITALALGIGANTAIFTVVNAVLLRALPFPHPEQLVMLYDSYPKIGLDTATVSPLVLKYYQENAQSLEKITAFSTFGAPQNLTGSGEPERVHSVSVTASFFDTLGVPLALGRGFTPQEDQPGSRVVVLSNGLWKQRYGGSASAIGSTITLDDENYTVIGVAPAGFDLPKESQLWVPFGFTDKQWQSMGEFMTVIGRMKPGVTLSQVQAENATFTDALLKKAGVTSEQAGGFHTVAFMMRDRVVGDVRPALLVLLAAVGCVLLIACANVANLLLARATGRQKEIAIRAALGASRWRTMRQLLTESVLLSLIGGGLGIGIAYWGVDALLAIIPTDLPSFYPVTLDGRVLLFALGLSLLTGLLFGALPSLQVSRTVALDAMREGSRGGTATGARQRMRAILVVTEFALALVLLAGAGLLIRSFVRLQHMDPGFDANQLLTFHVSLPKAKYQQEAQMRGFYRQAVQNLAALPGVKSVAASSSLPLEAGWTQSLAIEGLPLNPPPHAFMETISPDYLRTMGIAVLRGRGVQESDNETAPGVVLIDATFAQSYFGNVDPIGKRVNVNLGDKPDWRQVVGIVGDVKRTGALQAEHKGQVYLAAAQSPERDMVLEVRTAGDPLALASAARAAVLRVDAQQPVYDVKAMTQVMEEFAAQPRFNMLLLGLFAALALVLAAVGIYGVVSYAVTQRTHEIGIRMALGAKREDVLRMVLAQGMKMAGVGVVCGFVGSVLATRALAGMLYGVRATDPLTFTAVAALLSLVALLACYMPARRATRVDPMVALRYE
ncbi:MAG TPA: ABC transporter permease [Terriglobales bacterium]|nr:ABC transporter permease [Terriglobales bacterium]